MIPRTMLLENVYTSKSLGDVSYALWVIPLVNGTDSSEELETGNRENRGRAQYPGEKKQAGNEKSRNNPFSPTPSFHITDT